MFRSDITLTFRVSSYLHKSVKIDGVGKKISSQNENRSVKMLRTKVGLQVSVCVDPKEEYKLMV